MGKPSQVILLNPSSLSKQHSATPAFVHLWYAAPLYAELPVWLCSGNVLCSVVLESRYMPCKGNLALASALIQGKKADLLASFTYPGWLCSGLDPSQS